MNLRLALQRAAQGALADENIPAGSAGLERLEDEHAATANPETLLTTARDAVLEPSRSQPWPDQEAW